MSDDAPFVLDDNDGGDADAGTAPMMPTPSGSILALARGQNQNDYLTIVRIDFPKGAVTPLFTFQPANGMHARAIALRPDGALDRFDVENQNQTTATTHVVPISKSTGAPVGPERVFDGMIGGADYAGDGTLWAVLSQISVGTRIVTIDAMNVVTTIVQKAPCTADVGLLGNVTSALVRGCGEDVFWDDLVGWSSSGQSLGDIASHILMWDAMTPMGPYLVMLDDYGDVQILDPKTKLWSALIQTQWHYRDATENQ